MARLIFAGTGGWISTKYRNFICIVLEVGDKVYLLDVGEGALKQLQRLNIDVSKIKSIFVTHTHGDHILGLPGLAVFCVVLGCESLEVYAPKWTQDGMNALRYYLGPRSWGLLNFRYFDVDPHMPIYSDDTIEVYSCKMEHSEPSVAYKVLLKESATSIVYTGDTAPNTRLIDFSRGTDILLHEATLESGEEDIALETGHSTVRQAIEVGLEAEVKRLVLVHLGFQEFKRRRFTYKGLEIVVPSDGDSIEI